VFGGILPGLWLRHFSAARPANGVFYLAYMEQSSYYAVIPAFVRYCKDVPDGAKLLYGEITALCNEQGYCWASNKYFSDLYGKSGDTISRWISKLAQAGFILTIVDNQKGNTRKIWLSEAQAYRQKSVDPIGKNADTLTAKIRRPYRQKSVDPIDKNVYPIKENNTINITLNNTEEGENAQNALTPPFAPAGTIESDEHVEIMLHLLEAEKKENDFTGAGPTPPTELLVTTHTPQTPYVRVVERVEVRDVPGPKSPRDITKPGRRSQAAPTIHPENLQAFDHFSDPEKCRMLWSEWIEYKWGQHRDKYKTSKSELVMLRKLYTWSNGQAEIVSQIIEKSVGNLYKGLIDPNEKGNGTENRHDLNPAQRQHLALAQYVVQRRIDAENRDAME